MTTLPLVLGLERLPVDVTPLRSSRDFRLLFSSRTVTLLGSEATEVALLFQVKQLTGSPLAVGLLGLAELVALLAFALYGGVLADRLDRRRLMARTEIALVGSVALLLGNALLSRPLVWPLYVIAALIMALAAVQRPSIDATIPRTVPTEQLTAAAGLMGISSNSAMILGATLGGVLAAELGPASAYGLDASSFTISALCLLAVAPSATRRRESESEAPSGLGAIAEGMRFVAGRQDLIGSYLVDLAAMFLGTATALLPFVASNLHARWALGLMYASTSIGALVAAALSGWSSHVTRYGRAIALSGAAWGLAMIAFGLSGTVWLAVAMLILAGAADMYSGVFRGALWNRTIPDELRGRVAGIELLSYGVGPTAGQMRAGVVASLTSVRVALWSGGVLCVATIAGVYAALPRFARFDTTADDRRALRADA